MIDVLIAGGGPVGLAAAIEARRVGMSVTLLEPRPGTIDKACGEGLMPGALPLLQRLGIDPPGMPLAGVAYVSGTRRVEHRFADGPGRGVRRTELHAALRARALELGVNFLDGRVDNIEQSDDSVTVGGLRSRWLLACDGLHSEIRRRLGVDRATAGVKRFGLRRHFAVAPWSPLIEVHWLQGAEAYVTPVAADTVGLAVLGPKRTDFAAAVAAIPQLAGAHPVSSLRGAGPFRQRASRVQVGRVLLVGDAAGYVDAITGEGLRLGFDEARVAVESIVRGTSYPEAWREVTRDFRTLTGALVMAATSPLRPAIVPVAVALPRVFGAAVERLAR